MPSLKKLHDPSTGPMRVVAFMSGSGTNLVKIIEHQRRLETERGASPFKIVAIFSDNWQSRAAEIAASADVPVIIRDIASFYRRRGLPRKDLSIRPEFDAMTVEALRPFDARFAAYAGYMSVASPILVRAFVGVNVHPADLSAMRPEGGRRWTGGHAVRDAIKAGEKTVRSSTHIVEETVDGGRIVIISAPMDVEIQPGMDLSVKENLREAERLNQDRLKERGDWVIFPKTLEYIADGRISSDDAGTLHFDGTPIPHGLRM